MRIEIEPEDMESIVHKSVDLLMPLIVSMQREGNDWTEEAGRSDRVLMDVKGVAEYLGFRVSWVYDNYLPHIR